MSTIYLDYPVHPMPRYGYGKGPHKLLYEIINSGRDNYRQLLERFTQYQEDLKQIPTDADLKNPLLPYWNNVWIPSLDGLSIYCIIAEFKPAKYFEIGSGNSTKFAKLAISNYQLTTEMLSIDPCPRVEIDRLCDKVYRQTVETVELQLFSQLKAGDILFIDNSHRCFTNSDVTTVFLDIIPYLSPGVLIGIHDIFLPYDYPPEWNARYYSEQYLLASSLLARGNSLDIVLPNHFVAQDPELFHLLDPILQEVNVLNHLAGIFWLKTR